MLSVWEGTRSFCSPAGIGTSSERQIFTLQLVTLCGKRHQLCLHCTAQLQGYELLQTYWDFTLRQHKIPQALPFSRALRFYFGQKRGEGCRPEALREARAQALGAGSPGVLCRAAARARPKPRGSHEVRRVRRPLVPGGAAVGRPLGTVGGRLRGGGGGGSRRHAAPQGGQPPAGADRERRGRAAAGPLRGGRRPRQGPGEPRRGWRGPGVRWASGSRRLRKGESAGNDFGELVVKRLPEEPLNVT